MAAATDWGQIGSSPLVWQLTAINSSSVSPLPSQDHVVPPCPLCWLWSSPDPGEVTSAWERRRKLSQQKEREGEREFLFFSFLFHLTAGLVRWIYTLRGQTNGKPRERQGCTSRSGGGKTAPLPDCKRLDQISSFLPVRRTSSYSWGTEWIKLEDKIRFKSGHTSCVHPFSPIIPNCGGVNPLPKLIKNHRVPLFPLLPKQTLPRHPGN